MNKVILVGRLTAEPEKIEANQKVLCKFQLATPENYTKNGKRETSFHTVIVWNTQAENCLKYLNKGSMIGLVGRISYRQWEDSKGNKKYATEIVTEEVEFLSSSKKGESKSNQQEDDLYGDDLP